MGGGAVSSKHRVLLLWRRGRLRHRLWPGKSVCVRAHVAESATFPGSQSFTDLLPDYLLVLLEAELTTDWPSQLGVNFKLPGSYPSLKHFYTHFTQKNVNSGCHLTTSCFAGPLTGFTFLIPKNNSRFNPD